MGRIHSLILGIAPQGQRLITLHQQQPVSGLDTLFHMIRRKMVCSRKRIYRLMRQLHIQSARKFAYKRTTNSRHSHPVAPNLLNRNFQVSNPNTVWVGDLHTFQPVKDGCIKGGTTLSMPDGSAEHLLTNFPSYHTKIP